jgi:hypothetical protein
MYLRVEYFDQNFSFASCLPRDGKAVRVLKSLENNLDWYLIRLNRPVEYENIQYSHFLLASRHKGCYIGDNKPVDVFILLVPSTHVNITDGFSFKQFNLVAWGTASVIPDQPLTNGN